VVSQHKASPSDKFRFIGVLVSVVPVLWTAILASYGGYLLGRWALFANQSLLIIFAWCLLLGMYILDQEPTWNFFLLVGFSFVGGMLIQGVGLDANQGKVWGSLAVGVMMALLWGMWSGSQLSQAGMYLFPITILYLLGWVGCSFYSFPSWLLAIWAGLGWLLFMLIGTAVVSRGSSGIEEVEPISLCSDLYVIFFNLFWLGILFWNAVY